jgi:hypothetical protein
LELRFKHDCKGEFNGFYVIFYEDDKTKEQDDIIDMIHSNLENNEKKYGSFGGTKKGQSLDEI